MWNGWDWMNELIFIKMQLIKRSKWIDLFWSFNFTQPHGITVRSSIAYGLDNIDSFCLNKYFPQYQYDIGCDLTRDTIGDDTYFCTHFRCTTASSVCMHTKFANTWAWWKINVKINSILECRLSFYCLNCRPTLPTFDAVSVNAQNILCNHFRCYRASHKFCINFMIPLNSMCLMYLSCVAMSRALLSATLTILM